MPKRYVTNVVYKAPSGMPNGLQSTPEGLWVCDQIDPNLMYLMDPEKGEILKEIPTRCLHGSGITRDPHGRIWVSSTFGYELVAYDVETGKEVAAFRRRPATSPAAPTASSGTTTSCGSTCRSRSGSTG